MMRGGFRAPPLVLFLCLGMGLGNVAQARDHRRATNHPAKPTNEGRRHYQTAERLFDDGRFAEAMAEYEDGYRVTHLPGFLVNMARCRIRLGQLTEARVLYLRFLDEAPGSPRRTEVDGALAVLEQRIAADAAETSRLPFAEVAAPPMPQSARDRERRLAMPTSMARPMATLFNEREPAATRASERAPWLGPVLAGAVASVVVGAALVLLAGLKSAPQERGTIGTLTR